MNRVTIYDFEYDDTTQDLKVTAGDLVLLDTRTDILNQLLKDALESDFNSMKYLFRWGNRGKAFDFTTIDNIPKQKMFMYFEEMMVPMDFLIKASLAVTPDYAPSGFDGFEYAIEATLSDISSTAYSKTLQWNQSTSRSSVV